MQRKQSNASISGRAQRSQGQRSDLAARAPLHAQVGLLPNHAIACLGSTRTLFLGTPAPFIRKRAVRLLRGRQGQSARCKPTTQKRLRDTERPPNRCSSPTTSISGRARRRQRQRSDLGARAPLHAIVGRHRTRDREDKARERQGERAWWRDGRCFEAEGGGRLGRDVCYPRREAAKCRLGEEARATWRQEGASLRRRVRMAHGIQRWRKAEDERDRGRRAKPTAFEPGRLLPAPRGGEVQDRSGNTSHLEA